MSKLEQEFFKSKPAMIIHIIYGIVLFAGSILLIIGLLIITGGQS